MLRGFPAAMVCRFLLRPGRIGRVIFRRPTSFNNAAAGRRSRKKWNARRFTPRRTTLRGDNQRERSDAARPPLPTGANEPRTFMNGSNSAFSRRRLLTGGLALGALSLFTPGVFAEQLARTPDM